MVKKDCQHSILPTFDLAEVGMGDANMPFYQHATSPRSGRWMTCALLPTCDLSEVRKVDDICLLPTCDLSEVGKMDDVRFIPTTSPRSFCPLFALLSSTCLQLKQLILVFRCFFRLALKGVVPDQQIQRSQQGVPPWNIIVR